MLPAEWAQLVPLFLLFREPVRRGPGAATALSAAEVLAIVGSRREALVPMFAGFALVLLVFGTTGVLAAGLASDMLAARGHADAPLPRRLRAVRGVRSRGAADAHRSAGAGDAAPRQPSAATCRSPARQLRCN
jgi:hypothetical protein